MNQKFSRSHPRSPRKRGVGGRRSSRKPERELGVELERAIGHLRIHPKVKSLEIEDSVVDHLASRPRPGSLVIRRRVDDVLIVYGYDRSETFRLRVRSEEPEVLADYIRRKNRR